MSQAVTSATTSSNAPKANSYVERALSFKFELGKGSFGTSGDNTVKINSLRAHVTVLKNGFPSMNSAEMRIYGLDPQVMNAISTLGSPRPMERLNTVSVYAGDSVNGLSLVYTGTVQDAWQNFNGQPDTFLEVQSFVSTFDATKPVPPISFPGSADVATMFAGLATQAGRAFENNGVQVTLANPYFAGTTLSQAHDLARAANIEFHDDGSTFAIWPKDSTRGGVIPLIGENSGMIGYPDFTSQGIRIRTVYNPNILFGGQVKVETTLKQAQGIWYVNKVSYSLTSRITNGPWQTEIECNRQPGVPGG